MKTLDKLTKAFEFFDEANSNDPHTEKWKGKAYPKELLYAIHMTNKLHGFAPNPSEALQLTARCQHIRRWEIPRESYEMDRTGYLRWRQDLKKFHAEIAGGILKAVGYGQETIDRVTFLLEKRQKKKKRRYPNPGGCNLPGFSGVLF